MLLNKNLSHLLLIDVQEKLTPYVIQAEKLVQRIEWILKLAKRLNVPTIVTEQYPKGLGITLDSLKTASISYSPISKVSFSCYKEPKFQKQIEKLSKKQLILIGIETHVCVLQTAMDLKQNTDNDVFVVVDAVSSRSELDNRYGLKRMKQAGVELVTSEMLFFEWIEQAGTDEFKELSRTFLK